MLDRVASSVHHEDYEFAELEFGDHLEFADAVNDSFDLQCRSIQLSAGPNLTRYSVLRSDSAGFAVGWTRWEQSQYIEFRVPDSHVLISTSRTLQPFYCNGFSIAPAAMTIYPGEAFYRGLYPEHWDAVDILISKDLQETHELLGTDLVKLCLQGEMISSVSEHKLATPFFNKLIGLFEVAEQSNDPDICRTLGEQALQVVLEDLKPVTDSQVFSGADSHGKKTRRADLLTQATEFISANLHQELTARGLAEALGVTYRLLHYSFRDALNVSPYQFILTMRLHALRNTLKNKNLSVRDACYSHGFFTLSRTRQQYQRLFGELPSETRPG